MAGPMPQYIPPPPPPPPPGYGNFISKPTSGKAIASLVCGLAGGVGALVCIIPGVAALVGVILGILGIIETGREGTRSGRGMAIAGTIVSALAVVGMGAFIAFFAFMARQGAEKDSEHRVAQLDREQREIMDRLKQYYLANNNSLGPGGPILGGSLSSPPVQAPVDNSSPDPRPRVTGTLKLHHLVDLSDPGSGKNTYFGWELQVTGPSSATLSVKGWGDEVEREVVIQDIGRDLYSETIR